MLSPDGRWRIEGDAYRVAVSPRGDRVALVAVDKIAVHRWPTGERELALEALGATVGWSGESMVTLVPVVDAGVCATRVWVGPPGAGASDLLTRPGQHVELDAVYPSEGAWVWVGADGLAGDAQLWVGPRAGGAAFREVALRGALPDLERQYDLAVACSADGSQALVTVTRRAAGLEQAILRCTAREASIAAVVRPDVRVEGAWWASATAFVLVGPRSWEWHDVATGARASLPWPAAWDDDDTDDALACGGFDSRGARFVLARSVYEDRPAWTDLASPVRVDVRCYDVAAGAWDEGRRMTLGEGASLSTSVAWIGDVPHLGWSERRTTSPDAGRWTAQLARLEPDRTTTTVLAAVESESETQSVRVDLTGGRTGLAVVQGAQIVETRIIR